MTTHQVDSRQPDWQKLKQTYEERGESKPSPPLHRADVQLKDNELILDLISQIERDMIMN